MVKMKQMIVSSLKRHRAQAPRQPTLTAEWCWIKMKTSSAAAEEHLAAMGFHA